jgi:hypothetical protein
VSVLLLAAIALVSWPPDAHAQKIPWIVLPLASSPLVALMLSGALGIVTRSWLVGLANTALVILWVVWFATASNYSTSDLLIWASIAGLGLHSLAMIGSLSLLALRRGRARRQQVPPPPRV